MNEPMVLRPFDRGEVLSIAFAGEGQHQDAGAKITHLAPNTTSQIIGESSSKGGGRASYRGLLKIAEGADNVNSNVVCDALLLDEDSRSDTYPTIEVDAKNVSMGHEASVSRIGEDQLFYLMSRGLNEDEANALAQPVDVEASGGDVGAVDQHPTGLDTLQSCDRPDQGRLAGAGRADQHLDLAAADLAGDVGQHLQRPEPFIDVLEADHDCLTPRPIRRARRRARPRCAAR